MEIVVAKKYRLIEESKGVFKINEHRKEIRKAVKLEKSEIEAYNKIASKTGILYEIDEKATKERNNKLNPKKDDGLDRDALKAEADSMGLEYKKNIKTQALKELIETNKQ